MTTELWRHLVTWELRHTLRSASFWAMAAIAFISPIVLVAATAADSAGLGPMDAASRHQCVLGFEIVLISVLVSLWTVFAVKREVGTDVADDWLLVLRYRQTLVSRYVAGFAVGVLLVAVTAAADLALLVPSSDDLGARLAMLAWAQALKLVSLLQPLALAAIVIAAADFLVAAIPVVLFVLVCLDLFWCAIPVSGFATGAVMLLVAPASLVAWFFLVSAVGVSILALAVGWYKAEDFCAYLKLTLDQRHESLGAVRTAVTEAQRSGLAAVSKTHEASRRRWTRLGFEPLAAHDLARYPAGPRRTGRAYLTWQVVALAAIVLVLAFYGSQTSTQQSFGAFVFYFAWWLAAVLCVVRALVSGAQIVVAEREQGTLACLLITRMSIGRILNTKLRVVVLQALPLLGLLLLAWVSNPHFGGSDTEPMLLVYWTIEAVFAGCLASALAGSRLLALLLGGVFLLVLGTANQAMQWLMVLANGPQWFIRTPFDWLLPTGLALLPALLAWYAARPLAERLLIARAAEIG